MMMMIIGFIQNKKNEEHLHHKSEQNTEEWRKREMMSEWSEQEERGVGRSGTALLQKDEPVCMKDLLLDMWNASDESKDIRSVCVYFYKTRYNWLVIPQFNSNLSKLVFKLKLLFFV